MYLWEIFEQEILDDLDEGATFTSNDVAAWLGVSGREATRSIQGYLSAQRSKKRLSRTRYVLHREGRTARTVWKVGARTKDARATLGQFGDDVKHRILRAVQPDLTKIAMLNPRAARQVSDGLEPLVDGLAQMIEAVLVNVSWDGNG